MTTRDPADQIAKLMAGREFPQKIKVHLRTVRSMTRFHREEGSTLKSENHPMIIWARRALESARILKIWMMMMHHIAITRLELKFMKRYVNTCTISMVSLMRTSLTKTAKTKVGKPHFSPTLRLADSKSKLSFQMVLCATSSRSCACMVRAKRSWKFTLMKQLISEKLTTSQNTGSFGLKTSMLILMWSEMFFSSISNTVPSFHMRRRLGTHYLRWKLRKSWTSMRVSSRLKSTSSLFRNLCLRTKWFFQSKI